MIRRPTPERAQLDFWRRTVAGERVPRFENEPQSGFYRMRMVKGGPWVPVEIWLEQETDAETGDLVADERLRAICNGVPRDPEKIWPWCRAIPVEEYDALIGVQATLEEMEATHVAVNLNEMAAIRP